MLRRPASSRRIVVRGVIGAVVAGLELACGGAVAACASTPSDYTPQIPVVPGAAARSLWIASKNPPPPEKDDADSDAADPGAADLGAADPDAADPDAADPGAAAE